MKGLAITQSLKRWMRSAIGLLQNCVSRDLV
ncbi:hypothetical protein Golax_025875, partial [Gossypium laxum]|nr:hypothetical protein [Gossypium laxum]